MKNIRTKEWVALIDEWMKVSKKKPMNWERLLELEYSRGDTFFNSIAEAKAHPETYAGKWFKSGQKWFDLYNKHEYVYSLLFGQRVVSTFAYRAIFEDLKRRKWLKRNIIDVGGSMFTAFQLVQLGVPSVTVENFDDSPQVDFIVWASHKLGLPISTAERGYLAPNSILICSEYLEHFKDVDEEVARLVDMEPFAIYERSAFCTPAYGHFSPIKINDRWLDEDTRNGRRLLVKEFAKHGYSREYVVAFNKRPFLFRKAK